MLSGKVEHREKKLHEEKLFGFTNSQNTAICTADKRPKCCHEMQGQNASSAFEVGAPLRKLTELRLPQTP